MRTTTRNIAGLSLLTTALASPVSVVKRSIPASVPSYVVEYAPIVHLFSGENYLPADIGSQLPPNTQPTVNFTAVTGAPSPLTLDNLSALNGAAGGNGGSSVFLSSVADVSHNPAYLHGVAPDANGQTGSAVSSAIIVNDHGASGLVDAFYMYFYAFDYGGDYFGLNVGDHVGDWEHTMVRFQNGTPQAVWYSQHANGEAFTYAATEKYAGGVRPVVYCANGTHANYATPGSHDHTIPNLNLPVGPVEDHTDAGPIWDPTLSAYYYTYTIATNHSTDFVGEFAAYDGAAPVDWLYFKGHWGDDKLPTSDARQSCPFNISGLCKYVGGPTGPEDKQLNRTQVCPNNGNACILRSFLTAK